MPCGLDAPKSHLILKGIGVPVIREPYAFLFFASWASNRTIVKSLPGTYSG